MDNKFYGRITKSGINLQIHVPKDFKDIFKYGTFVCVYALDTEEIINEEIIRNVIDTPREMELYDARKIIESYDKNYNFKPKSRKEIMEHAKELVKE